jgi:ketosteroid isomerase-like protein
MDEAAFRAYIAEFNAGNLAALVRCYADDVVFSFNGGRALTGRGVTALAVPAQVDAVAD